jgi:hypothetical protein
VARLPHHERRQKLDVESRHTGEPPRYCRRSGLQAIDSRTAWFTFTAGTSDRELYATDDAGKNWRRIRPS